MEELKEPDSSGLVFRSKDAGPGLHALLVGVSKYPYLAGGEKERKNTFGLGQLDSPARTVWEVATWLLKAGQGLEQPLRTLRILASPSDAELHAVPDIAKYSRPATLENLQEAGPAWRDDAATSPDGAALFFFSGHGIQRTRGDSTLLLEDFNSPRGSLLGKAVELGAIYNGMAEPSDTAQTQYFVVDACRTDIKELKDLDFVSLSTGALWDVTIGGQDNRTAPIFFGSAVGRQAFGSLQAGGISAFGTDFLQCVQGAAADRRTGPWMVTVGTLARALRLLVTEDNQRNHAGKRVRSFNIDKWTDIDVVLTKIDNAPPVKCRFALVPAAAANSAEVNLLNGLGVQAAPFPKPLAPNPFCLTIPAGGYMLSALVGPPFKNVDREIITITPPFYDYELSVRS